MLIWADIKRIVHDIMAPTSLGIGNSRFILLVDAMSGGVLVYQQLDYRKVS